MSLLLIHLKKGKQPAASWGRDRRGGWMERGRMAPGLGAQARRVRALARPTDAQAASSRGGGRGSGTAGWTTEPVEVEPRLTAAEVVDPADGHAAPSGGADQVSTPA